MNDSRGGRVGLPEGPALARFLGTAPSLPPHINMSRIVVTGLGIVSPLGVGVRAAWSRLLAGGCGVRRIDALRGLPSEIAAPVPRSSDGSHEAPFDASQCRLLERGDEQSMAAFAQFALAATAEALDSAHWAPQTDEERERTGVAIGSGIGSLSDIIDAADALRERGHRRVSPYFIPKMLVNMAAGQVSIRAGLRGPLAAPATACATGAHAISDAAHLITSGSADVVVAGGAESCIVPLAVAGFSKIRALSTGYNDAPLRASRPFDSGRDGFVLGEGAAVLVLESEAHARARGAPVLAELAGVGLSADAHHITAPPDDGSGALRAMRAALGGAARVGDGGCGLQGPTYEALDYVNAHATSTPTGDAAELRAIGALVRGRPDGSPPLLVSATKGATVGMQMHMHVCACVRTPMYSLHVRMPCMHATACSCALPSWVDEDTQRAGDRGGMLTLTRA